MNETLTFLSLDTKNLIVTSEESRAEETSRAIKLPCTLNLIQMYDQDQFEIKFNSSYFLCDVCFAEKLGKDCIEFNKCHHVYCTECMKQYFETRIADGDVKKLICPADKCETHALPSQVNILKTCPNQSSLSISFVNFNRFSK